MTTEPLDIAAALDLEDASDPGETLDESLLGSDPALHEALRQLYEKTLQLEMLQAQAEQNAMDNSLREARSIDGVGEVVRRVHPSAYHLWAHDLGDYACWQDKGFTKYFDKIAPECKVRSRGTRIQVGHTRPVDCSVAFARQNAPRFFKAYTSETTDDGRRTTEDRPNARTPHSALPTPHSALE